MKRKQIKHEYFNIFVPKRLCDQNDIKPTLLWAQNRGISNGEYTAALFRLTLKNPDVKIKALKAAKDEKKKRARGQNV